MKYTYNCIIVDDERFARDLIADYLKQYPEFNLIGKYKNTQLAKKALELDNSVDLIFLDIQMPNETGIEFLKSNDIQQHIVLTTSYPEYALESYDLNVVDYLLKPITEKRFDITIQKLIHHFHLEEKAKAFERIEVAPNNYVKIKAGAEVYKIYFKELIRIQADGEYVKYITKDKSFLVLGVNRQQKLDSKLVNLSHTFSKEASFFGKQNQADYGTKKEI